MKTKLIITALGPSLGTPDKVESSIGTLQYKDGAPSKETAPKACDYLDPMYGVSAFVNAYQGGSVLDYNGEFPETGTYE